MDRRQLPWSARQSSVIPLWPSAGTLVLTWRSVAFQSPRHLNLRLVCIACQIELDRLTSAQFVYVTDSTAMQKPFLDDGLAQILPDSFFGVEPGPGDGVPFPGLSKLLLSADHLVNLTFIPPSLSALTNLEFLRLRFRCPRSRPALESRRPRPRPLTRSTIPSLTTTWFKRASEHLEILARIDSTPCFAYKLLQSIIFDTPQLFQFIS